MARESAVGASRALHRYEKIRSLQTQSKFRLLVVRLGAMGDILHALPAVTALRMAHPEWIIDWVVEPRWRALLAAAGSVGRDTGQPAPRQPLVDRLHLAPAKQWGKSPLAGQTIREFMALRRALREAKYDAAIDLQGAVRSAVFGRLAGRSADWRSGAARMGCPLAIYRPRYHARRTCHRAGFRAGICRGRRCI